MSIGTQKGPPIGVQEGPLGELVPVVHRFVGRGAECPFRDRRSDAPGGPVDPPVQAGTRCDQARFLNRQLSLPVSTISQ
jgi:hypothetical protein